MPPPCIQILYCGIDLDEKIEVMEQTTYQARIKSGPEHTPFCYFILADIFWEWTDMEKTAARK